MKHGHHAASPLPSFSQQRSYLCRQWQISFNFLRYGARADGQI